MMLAEGILENPQPLIHIIHKTKFTVQGGQAIFLKSLVFQDKEWTSGF